jgi:hypothetical protein
MASASKISREQFLLLRVVTKELAKEEFDAEEFGLQNQISQAIQLLNKSEDFKSFLDVIKQRTVGGSGYFAPIRKQQREILETKTLSRPLEGPPVFDETPVNTVLINFLQALQEITPDQEYCWRYSKAQLTAAFTPKEKKHGSKRQKKEVRSFTAVTDGQLQHAESCRIKVILECKKNPRPACLPEVSMQEAAQVVAWVRQYPSDERQ